VLNGCVIPKTTMDRLKTTLQIAQSHHPGLINFLVKQSDDSITDCHQLRKPELRPGILPALIAQPGLM